MASNDLRVNKKELLAVLDPFARVMVINARLPSEYATALLDEEPLRDLLPGSWPTVADLRRLHVFAVKHGWRPK